MKQIIHTTKFWCQILPIMYRYRIYKCHAQESLLASRNIPCYAKRLLRRAKIVGSFEVYQGPETAPKLCLTMIETILKVKFCPKRVTLTESVLSWWPLDCPNNEF